MKRIGGLRKRWLLNTAGIVLTLGLVCVIVVTLVFYAYYYSGMESDLRYRARTTSDFFAEFVNQSYDEHRLFGPLDPKPKALIPTLSRPNQGGP